MRPVAKLFSAFNTVVPQFTTEASRPVKLHMTTYNSTCNMHYYKSSRLTRSSWYSCSVYYTDNRLYLDTIHQHMTHWSLSAVICSLRRRSIVCCFCHAARARVGWRQFPRVLLTGCCCCCCAVSGNLFVSARCKCISQLLKAHRGRLARGWYGTREVQCSGRRNSCRSPPTVSWA